ncbi:nuclear polyadenylated RNA-binding protein 3-like isoform X2 [Raphanus sativus]|uniref:Nuclear polyadenylated RNA-binding protein 3-like isoform X2 n=1 Tax=Raphanus sativus TaxID=3726 RepID=A0A9W3DDC0_RAPSA|nr:nuclear polyadenylated RNA-binding protein 3-like isoform X2 [Raphanus sativus]
MGCGGSRLGGAASARAGEGGVVPLPEGIRPLLRRRLEEMKKRSHASVLKGSQTQSKKELLRHGSSEDGEEAEESDDSLKLSAKVAPAPDHHVEEKKEVIYEKVSSIKDVKEGEEVVKKQDEKIDGLISVKKERNDGGHDEDIIVKNQGDDDHDEGRMSNFDERMICPGSPSFRVYCINVTSSDDDDDDDDADDKEKNGEDRGKSMETESVIIESKEQNESIVKKKKKERKGKRFGMALPRKYLANVTAPCYAGVGRGCMGNNTHSRVVQEKSSQ